MWAAGLAAGVGLVAYWRVARTGFILLGVGVAVLIGGAGALAGTGWWGAFGCAAALLAIYLRTNRWTSLPLAAATLLWLEAAHPVWSWLVLASGALGLGAITTEMMLGHWYLVDPKLPRWPLRALAVIGVAGIAIDTGLVQVLRVTDPAISPVVLVGLGATSLVLMVAVWFALKGRSYTGVMAATGLSYLAVLTSLGAVVLGRAVL